MRRNSYHKQRKEVVSGRRDLNSGPAALKARTETLSNWLVGLRNPAFDPGWNVDPPAIKEQ
jgi:hypothetical protein